MVLLGQLQVFVLGHCLMALLILFMFVFIGRIVIGNGWMNRHNENNESERLANHAQRQAKFLTWWVLFGWFVTLNMTAWVISKISLELSTKIPAEQQLVSVSHVVWMIANAPVFLVLLLNAHRIVPDWHWSFGKKLEENEEEEDDYGQSSPQSQPT